MLMWSGLLFLLGILAFVDSVFNMGEIFRRVNSVMFLLISLALLVRTATKMKQKKVENYEQRIFNLERQIRAIENAKEKMGQF